MDKHKQFSTLTINSTTHSSLCICSQFPKGKENLGQQPLLFKIYVYCKKKVYGGNVQKKHLNKQLNWNSSFFHNLRECLEGKNSNLMVVFNDASRQLSLLTEVNNSQLRITMFEVLTNLLQMSAFDHMQLIHKQTKNIKAQLKHTLKQQQQSIQKQISQIKALKMEIGEKFDFETNYIKNSFIPVMNKIKQKIKRCKEGGQIEQIESDDDKSSSTRKIYKIKVPEEISQKTGKNITEQFINLFK